jgi:ABC-type glycerol-3-phosphate transport system permease component
MTMATAENAVSGASAEGERAGRPTTHRTAQLVIYAVLVPLALIFLFPFFWTLASSLKAPYEILTYPPTLLPAVPRVENYARVFALAPFGQWIFNTVWVVALGTLGVVLSSSLVAYSFARFRYRGRDPIFLLTLGTLMLPAQVTLIPQYIVWSKLGLANTLYPLWLPQWFGGGAFYIFLMRQFIMTIPRELDEAATIDGAGRFRIFWGILLPLCIPALATITIISFIANWDDYLTPLIYLNSQEMYTLALGLSFFRNYPETGGLPQQHLLMAATVMTTLPPIILFFVAQRYFVQGIVLSGLKG